MKAVHSLFHQHLWLLTILLDFGVSGHEDRRTRQNHLYYVYVETCGWKNRDVGGAGLGKAHHHCYDVARPVLQELDHMNDGGYFFRYKDLGHMPLGRPESEDETDSLQVVRR